MRSQQSGAFLFRNPILRIVNRSITFQVVFYFFDLESRITGNDSESCATEVAKIDHQKLPLILLFYLNCLHEIT